MKGIVIVTQKVDEEDKGVLGFFIYWLREFSKNFDEVFVITLMAGKFNLPKNVHVFSLGKENGAPKILQVLRFYKLLFQLAPKSVGIFCHMSPIFAVASWSVAFLFGKRIILWYLHRSVTLKLKLAEKLCYKIVTSTKESLNIKSRKIIELGHGIVADKFYTKINWNERDLIQGVNLLSVGRISKIKNYETLIKTVKILEEKGIRLNLEIIGSPIMLPDAGYFKELKKLVLDLGLDNSVKFIGFIPYNERFFEYFKRSDIFINLSPTGGIDKVILEAMSSGAIVLTSNEAMSSYLGEYGKELIFKYGNPSDLSDKLKRITGWSDQKKKEVSDFLLSSVRRFHNLENLISNISKLYF